jgi:hypothetical protein
MIIVACTHGPGDGLNQLFMMVYILWALGAASAVCTLLMILLPQSSMPRKLLQGALMLTYLIPSAALFLAADAISRAAGSDAVVIYCAVGAPALAVLHCICLAIARGWQRMYGHPHGNAAIELPPNHHMH